MLTETDLSRHADDLATWLRGRRYGSVVVTEVEPSVIIDNQDELAVQLVAILADPSAATWPADDLLRLRRDVRERAQSSTERFGVYVVPRAVSPEEQEPDPDAEI